MRWKISGIQRGKLQELGEILPTSLTTPTLPGSAPTRALGIQGHSSFSTLSGWH